MTPNICLNDRESHLTLIGNPESDQDERALREAQILFEQCPIHYNTVRPQSALGHRPPAQESIFPMDQKLTMHLRSNRTTSLGHANLTATHETQAVQICSAKALFKLLGIASDTRKQMAVRVN